MRIQHNIMAMNAYRNYNNNTSSLSSNLEKLSSGYKINRAGDDAAGLAISEKMRAQISGLDQAQSNVKDGISLVKTGEGALQEVQDMLNRMVTLATQSANGTYDDDVDRANLQKEVDSLTEEIDRIADSANFNGINLLDGTQAAGKSSVTDWGTGSNAVATMKLELGSNISKGKDMDGVSITLGSKTFKFEVASTADGNYSAGTVKVKATETATAIMGKLKTAVASISVTAADGKTTYKLNGSAAGKTITYKATTGNKGKGMDALDLPTLSAKGGLKLQIGDTSDSYNQIRTSISDIHVESLYIDGIDISTQEGAASAVDKIKNAINMVSSTRGDLGAIQNRLEHTQNNLSVMSENIQDAESTIRDTDIAEEMMSYTKNNILVQSAQAMLAQANSVPQGVLQLLQ
jgi:flagellin